MALCCSCLCLGFPVWVGERGRRQREALRARVCAGCCWGWLSLYPTHAGVGLSAQQGLAKTYFNSGMSVPKGLGTWSSPVVPNSVES